MKERVDPERSSQFNRTFLLSACLAVILAVLFVGLAYGCAKSSRPERPSNPPTPSGMSAQLTAVLPNAGLSLTL
jgi:hypothetical protein